MGYEMILSHGDSERAMLRVVTLTLELTRCISLTYDPFEWACAHCNLGWAYGSVALRNEENLRRSISCYEEGLKIFTEQKAPEVWASVQSRMGSAYLDLTSGDRDANILMGIERYESALNVYTEATFAENWARTQFALGNAYHSLTSGDRDSNLFHAIRCYESSLRVFTEKDFPLNWADAHNNIALTKIKMSKFGEAKATARKALRVYRKIGALDLAGQLEKWMAQF